MNWQAACDPFVKQVVQMNAQGCEDLEVAASMV